MIIDGKAIETRAAEKQLNYKQLATAAGLTEKTLQAARSGSAIRTDTAGRIAAALDLSISDLIKEAGRDNETI